MIEAWKRVKANKGSAGADGLTIEQTVEHLKTRWSYIREALLKGTTGLSLCVAGDSETEWRHLGNWAF